MAHKYPLRMKSKSSGRVVEFTGLCEGVVIKQGSNIKLMVGRVSNDWYEHTNTSKWESYTPIWLEQKK